MAKKQTATSETPIVSAAASSPARAKRTTTTKHSASKKMATPAPAAVPQAALAQINREEVAKLAYLYWEARGYQGGSPEGDWVRAERELSGREL